jgi:hypothetical protein
VGPSHHELKVAEGIVELQHREEVMWRQQSHIQWLSEGDRNTRFFHMRASKRKKRNRIERLRRLDGSLAEDNEELGQMARDFYSSLYTTEGTVGMADVLDTVLVSVSSEMNVKLISPFEESEIKTVLFQMFPLKAPSPDGYLLSFSRNTEIYVGVRLRQQCCESFMVRRARRVSTKLLLC